jgi:hypothetical protein
MRQHYDEVDDIGFEGTTAFSRFLDDLRRQERRNAMTRKTRSFHRNGWDDDDDDDDYDDNDDYDDYDEDEFDKSAITSGRRSA